MDATSNSWPASMPPLPAPLGSAFLLGTLGGPKRERTQAQILHAAVGVFASRGLGAATMQEIAQAAGVTTATLYNHFGTKEEVAKRLAVAITDTLCRRISDSYAHIADAAQRMAIGQRRYIELARDSPAWALLLLEIFAVAPESAEALQAYPLADLRAGVRQKKFKVPSEAAAMDAVNGICTQAIRRVAAGAAPPNHDVAAAALVLRALGMAPEEAAEVARRPLPAWPEMADDPDGAPSAARRQPKAR